MLATLLSITAALQGARELTPLSAKAGQLDTGMTRMQVIGRLGRPTWAVLPDDTGDFAIPDSSVALVLIWKNRPCAPIVVDFDRNEKAIGWDEGRAVCGKDVELLQLEPSDARSCLRDDRAAHCR